MRFWLAEDVNHAANKLTIVYHAQNLMNRYSLKLQFWILPAVAPASILNVRFVRAFSYFSTVSAKTSLLSTLTFAARGAWAATTEAAMSAGPTIWKFGSTTARNLLMFANNVTLCFSIAKDARIWKLAKNVRKDSREASLFLESALSELGQIDQFLSHQNEHALYLHSISKNKKQNKELYYFKPV